MEMAAKGEVETKNLPPTDSAALNHSLRVHPHNCYMGTFGSHLIKPTILGIERRKWKSGTKTER